MRTHDLTALIQHLIRLHPIAGSDGQNEAMAILAESLDPFVDEVSLFSYTDSDLVGLPGYVDVSSFGVEFEDYGVRPRPALVARLSCGMSGPIVALNGHVDVEFVPDPWNWPYVNAWRSGELRNGILLGRGAADMLAGVASIVHAVQSLASRRRELKGEIIVQFVVDEEIGGSGSLYALSKLVDPPHLVVICEPTAGQVCEVTRSFEQFEVTCFGRPCHMTTSSPLDNAVWQSARILALVEEVNTWCAARLGRVPNKSRFLCVGRMNAGSDAALPAEIAHLFVTAALPPDLPMLEVAAQLQARLAVEFAHAARRPVLGKYGVQLPASHTSDKRAVFLLREAAEQVGLSQKSQLSEFPSACDARLYEARGIPSVIFGPGELEWAHRAGEHVKVVDVYHHAEALLRGLLSILAPEVLSASGHGL